MTEKYKDKYRTASTRASFWDYGWNAAYFVTICTYNRKHWFGKILNGTMDLSPIGHIVNSCWYEIPDHFPFVELGAHVIMPNHVHGIITIDKPNDERNNHDTVETQNFASLPMGSTKPIKSPQPPVIDDTKNQFGPQSQNLASIIRGFKIGVTKNARKIHHGFAWQSRYHDHIIRNDKSFRNISEYIIDNPMNWERDRFYSE